MEFTSSSIISLVCILVCCGAAQTEVSLKVTPERCQFFDYESVSLSCEDADRPVSGWTVRRYRERGNGTCGVEWGEIHDGGGGGEGYCTKVLYPSDDGVYWCQSESGELSHSVNISITVNEYNEYVILESPVFPVTEGSDVTLRCLSKHKKTGKPTSHLRAAFHKDGVLFRTESTGQTTIHTVYKSDEGLYSCHISDLGGSSQSWLHVRGSSASKDNDDQSGPPLSSVPPPLSTPPPSSLPPYLFPLMGGGVCLILLVLGLFLWKKRRGNTHYV